MPQKYRREVSEGEKLRARADRCRQLADSVGNLEFAIKLNALSEEYESDAHRTEANAKGRIRWRKAYAKRPQLGRQHPRQKARCPSDALSAPKFTLQGRRTEKLQSGRDGMLSSTWITQKDAKRNIERKATAAKLALIRSR